jgi:MFS family permease
MKNWQQVLRRKEVLALCAMAFMADICTGIITPTFSLYAKGLGASLTLIGALGGINGLTRIFSAVPVGLLSDSRGRKTVLSAGTLLFTLSSFLYTVAPNPYFLFPIRALAGVAGIATFFIGLAHLGDIVAKGERGLAIGLYTTCMGLGHTIGSFIGGWVAETYGGYRTSYQIAALCALVAFIVVRLGLAGESPKQGTVSSRSDVSLSARLKLMVQEPNLLAASLANLSRSAVFAAIMSFFPLYLASLSVGQATVGSMFAARALCSTSARMPTGLLTTRFPSKSIMTIALALMLTAVMSISCTTTPVLLGILLVGEGIAFGMFFTSGQAFVAEHSASGRGTAIGVYSTAASLAATAAPFIFGFIADAWGLVAVFQVTGVVVLAGIGVLGYVSLWQRRARRCLTT